MRIIIKELSKTYSDQMNLKIDNFVFESNKVYGLVGKNGVGKTTLLKILANLDHHYKGQVIYDEEKTQNIQSQITYLAPNSYLLNRTVYDNIAYPLQLRKMSSDVIFQNVNEVIDQLGIEKLLNINARQISSGEKQKVALARALIFKPKLLLLDEPTANIDTQMSKIIENKLKAYKKQNECTIIYVSHQIDDLMFLCDRVLELRKENFVSLLAEIK